MTAVLTGLLVLGIGVSFVNLVVILSGVSRPRRASLRPAPAAPIAVHVRPGAAGAAIARARSAAARHATPSRPAAIPLPPAPAAPANDAEPDDEPTPAVSVDDVRRLFDELVESDPGYLAEVITAWINAEREQR